MKLAQIEKNLLILQTWTNIHHEMLSKFKRLKFAKGRKFFIASEEYAKLFASIMKLVLPSEEQ